MSLLLINDSYPYILITGAGSGIGNALARLLINVYNAQLILIGRKEEPLKSLAHAFPNNVRYISADVSLSLDRNKIVQFVQKNAPSGLTHVVHNAGLVHPVAKPLEVTEEAFDYQMGVTVKGPFFLTNALMPHVNKGGRFLYISSGAAFKAWPGIGTYSIAKSALEMLAAVYQKEYGAASTNPSGHYFSALRPGGVDTPLLQQACEASSEIFPARDQLLARKKAGDLLTSEYSARFISYVLLHTPSDQYESSWNINNEADKKLWTDYQNEEIHTDPDEQRTGSGSGL